MKDWHGKSRPKQQLNREWTDGVVGWCVIRATEDMPARTMLVLTESRDGARIAVAGETPHGMAGMGGGKMGEPMRAYIDEHRGGWPAVAEEE